MKQQNLEQQCVAALSADPPPTLDQMLTLVAELEAGIVEADTNAEVAAKKFLDPVESPDIHAARDVAESAQARAARLLTLLPRLQGRAREIKSEEDRREWTIDFQLAAEKRNLLAKELAATYPRVVGQLVDLFNKLAANDAELSQLHGSRPSGAKGFLRNAELTARGLEAFSRDQPSLTRELRLPDWVESAKLAWPARAVPASVLLSEAVSSIHDPRRHSGDWHEVLKEDNARRIAEEQRRIADEQQHAEESRRAYERSLPR